jgi:ATP-dependent RNA helicase DeaD
VHAELPRDRDTLQHRSGRTGRAGRKGLAVMLVPANRRREADRLLAAARIQAEWGPPPSAEQIRARDNERLVAQAIEAAGAATAEAETMALGRAVLEAKGAEAVAAALLRALGAALPAPEEIELQEPAPRGPPQPRDRREGGGEGTWFRLSVGRAQNADPRWLLPFLCRRGHVTRQEVGRIQVMERETRVEIAPWAAVRFAAAAQRHDADDEDIRIAPMQPAAAEPAGMRPAKRRPPPATRR